LQYTSCGTKLIVGLVNGEVLIYDATQEKLRPLKSLLCKNKRGKFHNGRKVTGIEFINSNYAMITTNDSRIRFISLKVFYSRFYVI
jgi:hypothetical protein